MDEESEFTFTFPQSTDYILKIASLSVIRSIMSAHIQTFSFRWQMTKFQPLKPSRSGDIGLLVFKISKEALKQPYLDQKMQCLFSKYSYFLCIFWHNIFRAFSYIPKCCFVVLKKLAKIGCAYASRRFHMGSSSDDGDDDADESSSFSTFSDANEGTSPRSHLMLMNARVQGLNWCWWMHEFKVSPDADECTSSRSHLMLMNARVQGLKSFVIFSNKK